MSVEWRAIDARLSAALLGLLRDHGIDASARGDLVLVADDERRWVRINASDTGDPGAVRLHVSAAGPEGATLVDAWTGIGEDLEAALADGLRHFCAADFHVLLAGLWGLLEEDQVDHRVVDAEGGAWDLYLGAWVSRSSEPFCGLRAPARELERALEGGLGRIFRARKPHAGRVFIAVDGGARTDEGLVDMAPNEALDDLVRTLPAEGAATGYASQRLFFLALPRGEGPAHQRVGRCRPAIERPRRDETPIPVILAGMLAGVAVIWWMLR